MFEQVDYIINRSNLTERSSIDAIVKHFHKLPGRGEYGAPHMTRSLLLALLNQHIHGDALFEMSPALYTDLPTCLKSVASLNAKLVDRGYKGPHIYAGELAYLICMRNTPMPVINARAKLGNSKPVVKFLAWYTMRLNNFQSNSLFY